MKLWKRDSIFEHQILAAVGFLVISLLLSGIPAYSQSYDIIIENGRIIDGTGGPWFKADIAVRDSRIAFIGNLKKASAERRIDASGKFVVPGFIDIHTHSDRSITTEPWGAVGGKLGAPGHYHHCGRKLRRFGISCKRASCRSTETEAEY